MKKRLLLLFLTAILLLSPIQTVHAMPNDAPSLFAGDEAWYKDAISPLVVRDGVRYIPAEFLTMFDEISVTEPRGGNLLICNTETGAYISILFLQQSAAVNGEIIHNISIFRDEGMYYVDASLIAAVGLHMEVFKEPGVEFMRMYGEDPLLTFEELLASYEPQKEVPIEDDILSELPEEDTIPSYDGKLKRIYVLCKSPSPDAPFPAQTNCELYGLQYTWFLNENNTADDILSASVLGSYGLTATSDDDSVCDSLDRLNKSVSQYTRSHTRFTLSTGKEETDALLTEAGYIPITPDFVVNGSSHPDTLLPDIINYIGKAGSCTLLLEDCWNSERMAILLSDFGGSLYCTANLADCNLPETNP